MNNAIWLAAGATALGTLLIRMLPLYWMQRRRRASVAGREAAIPAWPARLAPLMIAALLGISLAPQPGSALTWGATMMGSLATLSCWYKTRSLGLPIATGVTAYALVIMSGS